MTDEIPISESSSESDEALSALTRNNIYYFLSNKLIENKTVSRNLFLCWHMTEVTVNYCHCDILHHDFAFK